MSTTMFHAYGCMPFEMTVLRGAFVEGTSLFCVFGYVIITIGYRKVYYRHSILFCLDKALTKSLVYPTPTPSRDYL